jgi:hypothetical protein
MNIRSSFLKVTSVMAVAAAAFAPAKAQAQSNRGQLVQAVVKLNQAQLAFVKKLADDQQFAAQFDNAVSSGNSDAAASLAASVTGLSKSSIQVGNGSLGGDDNLDAGSTESTKSVYKLASFSAPKARKPLSGKICFDVGIARGCIAF